MPVTTPDRGKLASVTTLLTVLVMLGGCGHKADHKGDSASAPVSVVTLTVQPTPTDVQAEVPGVVRPIREARIAPKIMSKVLAITVREGDRVRQGQVLVRLENRDLAAGVAQGAAAVAAARAGEKQARTALQMQRVTSSVEVRQAEAALRAAQANLEKTRRGPRTQQREQAEQAVASARAAVEQARAQLDILREGARKQERAQAGEAVKRAEQGVAAAQQGVAAAEAALRTAEADYKRMQALADEGVVPQQRLDHTRLQYESARAQLAQARAAEAQATAGLEQARQQQSLVEEGPRTQEVRQAEQALERAQAGLKQAELDLEMATVGGREEDVRAAQAAVTQAEQALRNARAAAARDQLRESDVAMAKASVGQAEAGLQSARAMLGYSTITAPISGIVTARLADPGSMAMPGVPLLIIADDAEYRLEASVPEKLANALHVGMSAEVRLDSLQAQWPARVVQMIPAADPASHTIQVKARLPRDQRIHTGLFGRLIFATGQRQAITVPETAIWREGSLTGVFVIEDSHAKLRMVQVGASREGTVEINSGLDAGEIVAASAAGLTDGVAVSSAAGGAS
ncbi:MAG: efflux RND transporter periplasmic adaptor subunit [Armatimonadetes bacterium]|nr:efflux RND transporter periplasmic adaptor subunit [Armatimonadota bacterium]